MPAGSKAKERVRSLNQVCGRRIERSEDLDVSGPFGGVGDKGERGFEGGAGFGALTVPQLQQAEAKTDRRIAAQVRCCADKGGQIGRENPF